MNVRQWHIPESHSLKISEAESKADLVIALGNRSALEDKDRALFNLEKAFPNAQIVASTAEHFIVDGRIQDQGIGIAAFDLTCSSVRIFPTPLGDLPREAGRDTAVALQLAGRPKAVLIFWGNQSGNAEEFLQGFQSDFKGICPVAGGVASDDLSFDQTAVYSGTKEVAAVVVAFYGDTVGFSSAAKSGWGSHGNIQQLTRTEGSTIYQIDGQPALDVYRDHIGEEEMGLPLTALHFPIQLVNSEGVNGIIRTPNSVDYEQKSISCCGNVREGKCRILTFTDPEDLFKASEKAAEEASGSGAPGFCFLFSCAARRAVLGPLADMEIDRTLDALHPEALSFGMYAYGEISCTKGSAHCDFHNQSMVVAMLNELPPHI